MGKMSRDKGKRGEREVAALFRAHGFGAYRGQQYRGGGDSPDVIHSIPNVHVEVKFVEALSLYKALEKERAEADKHKVPVVFHRRKSKPWVVILYADDFLRMVKEIKR